MLVENSESSVLFIYLFLNTEHLFCFSHLSFATNVNKMATDRSNLRQRDPNNDNSSTADTTSAQHMNSPPFSSNPWNCWSQFSAPPPSEKPADGQYKSFNEYCNALRTWLAQYQMHQQMNQLYMSMPYYTMGYVAGQQVAQQQHQTQQRAPARPAATVRPQPAVPRPARAQRRGVVQ